MSVRAARRAAVSLTVRDVSKGFWLGGSSFSSGRWCGGAVRGWLVDG